MWNSSGFKYNNNYSANPKNSLTHCQNLPCSAGSRHSLGAGDGQYKMLTTDCRLQIGFKMQT